MKTINHQKLLSTFLLCAALLAGIIMQAQVSWQLRASSHVVNMHDQVQVTYTLQSAISDNFREPKFSDWQITGGPMTSSSTSIDSRGKTMLMEISYFLSPKHTGKCVVPAAQIVVNNKTYESNKLVIEVLPAKKGSAVTEQQSSNSNEFTYDAFALDSRENAEQKIAKNLFLEIKLNKSSCYEGEAIVAEYLLYSRVNLTAQLDKRPGFKGFSSIDLPSDLANGSYRHESKGGKIYKVYSLRKVQLTPLQHGDLAIEPLELSATVSFIRLQEGQTMSSIDPYFPDKTVEVPYHLTAAVTKVHVWPLPEANKPADGYSPVGRFSIKTTGPNKQISAGETGFIDVAIEGMGQWGMVKPPVVQWPKGITGFEPKIEESLDSQSVPVKGVRNFRYRFVADTSGSYTIAVKGFTHFDPWQKGYKSCADTSIALSIKAMDAKLISADDDVYGGASTSKATELFTRYAPMMALAAALLIVLIAALVMRSKKTKDEKEITISQPHHLLDEPEQSVAAAPTKKVEQTTEQWRPSAIENKAETAAPNIRELAKYYKQKSKELAALKPQHAAIIDAFMHSCDEIMYAPFEAPITTEALHEQYAALLEKLRE
ncbi:MAG TPA: BatD family protein [Phnomibacter sp.]|nr:BatD family protein [Phnomibacter sp.]